MRSQVSVHELTLAGQQARRLHEDFLEEVVRVISYAFSKLDVIGHAAPPGETAAAPRLPDTWEQQLWRRPRSVPWEFADRQLSNTDIALFSPPISLVCGGGLHHRRACSR